jgi:hypothetical protein
MGRWLAAMCRALWMRSHRGSCIGRLLTLLLAIIGICLAGQAVVGLKVGHCESEVDWVEYSYATSNPLGSRPGAQQRAATTVADDISNRTRLETAWVSGDCIGANGLGKYQLRSDCGDRIFHVAC